MDPRSILDVMKKASPVDLFLLSFVLLPFIFDAWLGVLEKLRVGETGKLWSLVVVLVAYVLGVLSMLASSSRIKRREIARDRIVGYLTTKNLEMISFEGIREHIDAAYMNDFLISLTQFFPNDVRRAVLNGDRQGLGRIVESIEICDT